MMPYDILNEVKAGNFLPYYRYMYTDFASSDTKEFFLKNLQVQPTTWPWRYKSIHYTYNSRKYRCPEWDTIDWHNSIVLFGGSDMFGVGVDDSETIAAYLQEITDVPVINLGISGSSMIYNLHNMIQYCAGNRPMPKAVFVMWPHHSRLCMYQKNWIEAYGHWNAKQGGAFDIYNEDATHAEINAIQNHRIAEIIWKDTRFISASLFEDTSEIIGCTYLEKICNCVYDSRDLQHTGPESNKRIADWVAQQL